MLVRTVATPFEELSRQLESLPLNRLKAVEFASVVKRADGQSLEPDVAQRFAPAIGVAMGRG